MAGRGGAIKVSGLEINEAQITLLTLRRSGHVFKVAKIAKKALEAGTIVKGVIKNQQTFTQALIEVKKTAGVSSPYIVVALPESLVYLTNKKFPNLEKDQLQEAIELNLAEFMPGKKEDIYWGWQESVTPDGGKLVTFASARQEFIKDYLKSLALANLIPIAIEPSSLAAGRAFIKPQEAMLLTWENNVATAIILKGSMVKFSTSFSVNSQDMVGFYKKILKILNFYLSENPETKIQILAAGDQFSKDFAQELADKTQKEVKFAAAEMILQDQKVTSPIVLGAASRGLMEQKSDTNLSLLPVGTQEAYEEKMVLRFFGGLVNIISITCLLFLLIFYGFWGFLIYLQNSTSEQLATLSKTKANSQVSEIQKKVLEINPKLELMQKLTTEEIVFSPIFGAIKNAASDGISITNLSWVKQSDQITITGKAQSREALSKLKETLASASYFSKVDLSSTNITEGQNISFTVDLKLKNIKSTPK